MSETIPILSGVVGSVAYGLATEESDVDRLGIFAAPTVSLLGLHAPSPTQVWTNPDVTYHEAGKFCRLALGGNPTVMELLWLERYDEQSHLGLELVEIRKAFLSARRVRDAYLGYATQQFHKLELRGDGSFSADTRKRTAKHARHLLRLCYQGYDLYRTGELSIRLNDGDVHDLREFGDGVAAGDVERARATVNEYKYAFDNSRTVLPERPDEDTVERWLLRVRRAFYE